MAAFNEDTSGEPKQQRPNEYDRLSAVALPDELEVVTNLRSDAAQLLRMSKATKFGEDLSVRVTKPDLLISNMVAAAAALSQAHSTIAALRAERDEALADPWKAMGGLYEKWRHRAETAEAEVKRLTEALKPFVDVRDQYPESVKLIDKDWSGYSLVSVQVTKDQFLAARATINSREKGE